MINKDIIIIALLAILLFIMAKDKGLIGKPLTQNAEVWEWTDYRGKTYKMTVSRNMH